ncbi:F-box protein [Capsicum chinense]|nr:F-box protein [Capsicum chinense]
MEAEVPSVGLPRSIGSMLCYQLIPKTDIDCKEQSNRKRDRRRVEKRRRKICVAIDKGLRILASGCPNLRRLLVVNASELELLGVAEESPTLQVLELHRCNDQVSRLAVKRADNLSRQGTALPVVGLFGLTVGPSRPKSCVTIESFPGVFSHLWYLNIRSVYRISEYKVSQKTQMGARKKTIYITIQTVSKQLNM